MKKIDLGDGEHAVIREMSDLKRGHVRDLYRKLDEAGFKPNQDVGYEGGSEFVDIILTAVVASWSFPEPVSLESLGELSFSMYKILDAATDDITNKILNLDQAPDPKSGPSSSTPARTASSSRGRKST